MGLSMKYMRISMLSGDLDDVATTLISSLGMNNTWINSYEMGLRVRISTISSLIHVHISPIESMLLTKAFMWDWIAFDIINKK